MKSSKIAARLLSVVLAVMMLFSLVTVGFTANAAKVNIAETGATITSDGTARLYFNMKAVDWWVAGNSGDGNFGYFFNSSTNQNTWSAHAVKYSGDTYYFTIPAGTWDNVILTRNNTSTAPSWDNKWNQTGDIVLSSTSNFLSKFAENSTSATWGTAIKPASTASLTAASEVEVGTEVILSAALTSNSTINTVGKVAYTVSPATATIEGNAFVANEAGDYTVTATVTYYPNGYSSLTSTATATATIKATAPVVEDTTTGNVDTTVDETTPAETTPAETTPGDVVDTKLDLPYEKVNGLYAYAGTEVAGTNAWQRWHDNNSTRHFFLPATASDTEVVILNTYSAAVTVNGVTIPAGEYATVPYTDGATYTCSGATTQKVYIAKTDAEGTMFINSADGMSVEYEDGTKEKDLAATYDLYAFLTGGTKNREAKAAAGAVASEENGINETAIVKKIKGRGNTTWSETKKPFNITYEENIQLDGMKGKKWSLLANAKDGSLLRNRLVYDMANEIAMTYACDSRFVDFFVNGYYKGSYQLTQKIEMGKNTVMPDLEEPITEIEEEGDVIPTADFDFILELDTESNAQSSNDLYFNSKAGQTMTYKAPGEPTAEQVEFIKAKYQAVEDALYGDDMETLEKLVDLNDFAKAYLINEVSKNIDAGVTSCYFTYNNETGKFYTAPVWDYDNAVGNLPDNGARTDMNGNVLDLDGPSGWYAKELKHFARNARNVFGQAIYNESTTSDGKTFNDIVKEVWNAEFADIVDILNGEATATGRLQSYDAYMSNLTKTGTWNQKADGAYVTADWKANHTSLTMYTFDEATNTLSSANKTYSADFIGETEYAVDWTISRINWLAAQFSDAETVVPDGYITIYFENNWQWPDAKAYWWGSTIGTNPEWNGVALTNVVGQNDAGYDIYEVVIPEDITGLLFNGTGEFGAEQCEDITSGWYEGICYYMYYDEATTKKVAKTYDYNVPVETTVAETTVAETTVADTTVADTTVADTTVAEKEYITVYFTNNWAFKNVDIHYWGGFEGSEWPGVPMNFVETNNYGQDVYSYEIPADTTGVLFRGEHDQQAGVMRQTVDIAEGIVDGAGWYCESETDGKINVTAFKYEPTVVETTTAQTSDDEVETTVADTTVADTTVDEVETTVAETTVAEKEYITVYFTNNWAFKNVDIHYWGGFEGSEWPGVPMNFVETNNYGQDVYSYEIPADTTGVLFRGEHDQQAGVMRQTVDITEGIVDGAGWYCESETDGKINVTAFKYEPTVVETTTAQTSDDEVETTVADTTVAETTDSDVTGPDMPTTVTVYAINSAKWADVYAYSWNTGSDGDPAWPGAAMQKTGETVNGFDVYAMTFDVRENIIFNNNNNGSKTDDLTVEDGKYYDIKAGVWYNSLDEVPGVDASATNVYLVGNFNEWSTTANEFKLNEGSTNTATITLDLEAATTYEFKIVRDGAWTAPKTATTITESISGLVFSSSGQDNVTLTTTEAGTYTFTWTLSESKLAVEYPNDEITSDDEVIIPEDKTVKLAGSFTEWATGAIEMTQTEENGTIYATEVELEANTYEFKIIEFGTWLGNNGSIEDTAEGWTFRNGTDENGNEYGNCTLQATGGTYTFAFDTETDKLTITAVLDEEVVTPDEFFAVTWNESDTFTLNTDADASAVLKDSEFTFTVDATEGYVISAVIVDMETIYADENGVYTITVSEDTTILVITNEEVQIPVVEKTFTVMFVDYDNTIIAVAKVKEGFNLPAPEAPTRAGYEFTGWSQATDNVTKDMIVVAQYKKIVKPVEPATTGSFKVEIAGGNGFTLSINGGAARPQGTSYVNTKAPIGATVTVTANTIEGLEFLGWYNPINGACLSADYAYTLSLTGDNFIKAMYKTDVAGVSTVIFKNDKAAGGLGQVIEMQYYAAGEEIAIPDGPVQVGFDFVGWNMTAEEIAAAVANGENVTVLATWERQIVKVNVTVNGGTGAGIYNANSGVTVVANAAAAGEKFAYWVDGTGKVRSYETTYKFYPSADTTMTAVFVAEDETIEYQILVSMDAIDTVSAGTSNVFYYSWYVPEAELGINYVKAGILGINKDYYDETKFYVGSGLANMYDRGPSGANNTPVKSWTWTKSNVPSGQTWIAKAYVQYTIDGVYEDDGVTLKLFTVYSDELEATKD